SGPTVSTRLSEDAHQLGRVGLDDLLQPHHACPCGYRRALGRRGQQLTHAGSHCGRMDKLPGSAIYRVGLDARVAIESLPPSPCGITVRRVKLTKPLP